MKYLFQPVKPFVINQHFAENKACISTDGSRIVISCDGSNPPKGFKSLYGEKGHTGIDLKCAHGQEVYAAQAGVVYDIDTDPITGLDVRIEHDVNGFKFRTIYEHLLGHQVKKGDKVRTGQLIGWGDNTGRSSGDHLHFEYLVWNGSEWIQVDPMTAMQDMFALDFIKMYDKVAYLKEVVAKLADNLAVKLRT